MMRGSGFSVRGRKGEGVRRGPLVFLGASFLVASTILIPFNAMAFDCRELIESVTEATNTKSKRVELDVARVRVQPVLQKFDVRGKIISEEAAGYPALCSGFSVQLKNGRSQFVTAGHCLPEGIRQEAEDLGIPANKVYFVVDDGFVAKQGIEKSIQEGLVTEISTKRLKGRESVDIGFFSLRPNELKTTNNLALATRPPRYGDKLYAIGYPGGYGPTRFECRYVGVGLRTNGTFQDMIAIDELDCPGVANQPDDIGGMSGGAVVNAKNEVVGVVVQQIQAAVGHIELGSSEKMSRVGMVRLTEKNVLNRSDLYRPTRFDGKFQSRYLDWTTGEEVVLRYQMKKGQLNGSTSIEKPNGTVLESYEFVNGNWGM